MGTSWDGDGAFLVGSEYRRIPETPRVGTETEDSCRGNLEKGPVSLHLLLAWSESRLLLSRQLRRPCEIVDTTESPLIRFRGRCRGLRCHDRHRTEQQCCQERSSHLISQSRSRSVTELPPEEKGGSVHVEFREMEDIDHIALEHVATSTLEGIVDQSDQIGMSSAE